VDEKLKSVLPSKEIDPARVGTSKSTILAASFCQRKAFYMEHVRDEQGRRVHGAMPERVIFGTAVDTMSLALMAWKQQGWLTQEAQGELMERAIEYGVDSAKDRLCSETIDWGAFQRELTLAAFELIQFLRLQVLNLVGASYQGVDGKSLEYEDPEFGKLIGTPDVLTWDADGRLMVVDVKAAGRAKSESDLISAEMAYYTYLSRRALVLDYYPSVAYLVWVRSKKEPRWSYVSGPTGPGHEIIARAHIAATQRSVGAIAGTSFNTSMCGTCDWAKPIPGRFKGCEIGKVINSKGADNEQA